MKYPTVSTVWVAVIATMLVLLAVLPIGRAFSQEGSQILDRPFPYDIDRTEGPSTTMFEFLQDTGLSGGIVLMTDCGGAAAPLHWTAKEGSTFRQVLDDFQTTNPTYHWEIRGNALNLTPSAGIPPLLAAKVRSLDLQTTDQETNAGTALAMLQDLSEIREAATALHLSEGMYAGGLEAVRDSSRGIVPPPKVASPINVQLKDVSLQDALNAVAQAYGHTMWIYEQRTCDGQVTYKVENESQIQ